MTFKPIKYLNDKQFTHLYEMSQDGKTVRHIKTGTVIEPTADTRYSRTLSNEDNTASKAFGTKTLYRASWGKPLPEDIIPAISSSNVQTNAHAPKHKRGKRRVSPFKVKRDAMFSIYQHEKVVEAINEKFKKVPDITPLHTTTVEVYETTKKVIGKIILINSQQSTVLMTIDSNSWRGEGLWFYNYDTKAYTQFNATKHKTGYGNDKIIWPNLSE